MRKIVIILLSCIIIFCGIFYCVLFPIKYKDNIIESSKIYNINPYIIASVINTESSFNKNAISSRGAIGLMQIMPTTGEWIYNMLYESDFTNEILYIPEININIGTYYLKYLFDKFENIDTSLLAYNAGEGIVRDWLGDETYSSDGKTVTDIPYKESEEYVVKVKNNMKIYQHRI